MAVEPIDVDRQPSVHDDGAIPLTRPTVAAFIGRTRTGPVDRPVRVTSVAEFGRVFGGPCAFSFVPQVVEHYFQHGGHEAVVIRVANRATRGRIEIPAGGEHVLCLQAADPGSAVSLRASVDHDRVETQRDRFNLIVQRLDARGSELVRDQEIFSAASTNPADPRYIGALLEESALVRLAGPVPGVRPRATQARHPGYPLPYVPMSRTGTDGDALTDYDIIGSNAEGTGLFALERVGRVDLLCIPPAPGADVGVTSFVAAERYSRRRNALLIWDPPETWSSVAAALAGARARSGTGRNTVAYFPRIRRRGDAFRYPAGLPACGALAGSIARADSCGVWDSDAAAGTLLKTSLTPVVRVEPHEGVALRRLGVNALESAAGRGTPIKPRVTSAGAGAAPVWRDFARRRLLLFIMSSVEEAGAQVLRWAGGARAGTRLEDKVDEFLRALCARGAFAAVFPAQAFFVQPDDRGPAVVRFGVALRRPAEFTGFEIDLDAAAPRLRALPALEADQLAS